MTTILPLVWPTKHAMIRRSVGDWTAGAENVPDDVRVVQSLLRIASESMFRRDWDPLANDGRIVRPPLLSTTLAAIVAFQSSFLRKPDGVIEPGKLTFRKLREYEEVWSPNVRLAPVSASGAACCFPLAAVPKLSYKTGGRRFGARRAKGKRKHAGCDLIAAEGTAIYAVDDGKVIRGPYSFYRGTDALEIKHRAFLVRYAEIKSKSKPLVKRGDTVKKGQVIAYVGKMFVDSMLHFEMYNGTGTGRLTQRNSPPYQRRSDLVDPTPYLDQWKSTLPTA